MKKFLYLLIALLLLLAVGGAQAQRVVTSGPEVEVTPVTAWIPLVTYKEDLVTYPFTPEWLDALSDGTVLAAFRIVQIDDEVNPVALALELCKMSAPMEDFKDDTFLTLPDGNGIGTKLFDAQAGALGGVVLATEGEADWQDWTALQNGLERGEWNHSWATSTTAQASQRAYHTFGNCVGVIENSTSITTDLTWVADSANYVVTDTVPDGVVLYQNGVLDLELDFASMLVEWNALGTSGLYCYSDGTFTTFIIPETPNVDRIIGFDDPATAGTFAPWSSTALTLTADRFIGVRGLPDNYAAFVGVNLASGVGTNHNESTDGTGMIRHVGDTAFVTLANTQLATVTIIIDANATTGVQTSYPFSGATCN